MADNPVNATAIATLQNIVTQLSALNETLSTLFPTADNTVSATAGAASGDYLTINVAGVVYKIALLDP